MRFPPEISTRLMARFLRSYFDDAPPAARTSGNLFAPPADPGGNDGGLRSPGSRAGTVAAIAGLALVGALALSRATSRRR